MAGLQKLKLPATQCGISGSPTGSPVKSPAIRLRRRRRKTLRMLLDSPDRLQFNSNSPERRVSAAASSANEVPRDGPTGPRSRRKLKELLVSSPPPLEKKESSRRSEIEDGMDLMTETAIPAAAGYALRRRFNSSLRPVFTGFRHRLMRRAWRPVLVPIPE